MREAMLILESAKAKIPTKKVWRSKRWVSVYTDTKTAEKLERVWRYLYRQLTKGA